MRHTQISLTSETYEDPVFLETLEILHDIHPYIKFNT